MKKHEKGRLIASQFIGDICLFIGVFKMARLMRFERTHTASESVGLCSAFDGI